MSDQPRHEQVEKIVHGAVVLSGGLNAYRTDPMYHATVELLMRVLVAVDDTAQLSGMTPEASLALCEEVADRLLVGGARKASELLAYLTPPPSPGVSNADEGSPA